MARVLRAGVGPRGWTLRPLVARMRDERLDRIHRRVLASRYVVSEHVVRSILSRVVTVTDIETVLAEGVVIEDHEHGKRGVSILVCGLSAGVPVHVACAERLEWVVVTFAYRPARPVWVTPGRRAETWDKEIVLESMRCYFCGGTIKRVTVGNFDYRLEGALYVVKKVPAGLCLECGEKYLEPDVARRLGELIESGGFCDTEQVRVLEFGSA